MVPQRVEAVGSGFDGLMQSSKWQVRRTIREMSSSERRGKRAERREKREERDKHDQDERVEGRNGSVPEWRDGTEKGRPLRGKREESREKREQKEEEREKRAETREKRS